ncbi:hypothetical protein M422DRAFT_25964 [Sphaerobolus stellatus SS14]|nr:hypothetical protein M422DRAFT_25964 [Sphaerobolus stellatus SS14]
MNTLNVDGLTLDQYLGEVHFGRRRDDGYTVTFPGTGQYQLGAPNACTVMACSAAVRILLLGALGLRGAQLLDAMLNRQIVGEIVSIGALYKGDVHLNTEDVLRDSDYRLDRVVKPEAQTGLSNPGKYLKQTRDSTNMEWDYGNLLNHLRNAVQRKQDPVIVAVITEPPQTWTILYVPFTRSQGTYVVFDSHGSQEIGSTFTVNATAEGLSHRLGATHNRDFSAHILEISDLVDPQVPQQPWHSPILVQSSPNQSRKDDKAKESSSKSPKTDKSKASPLPSAKKEKSKASPLPSAKEDKSKASPLPSKEDIPEPPRPRVLRKPKPVPSDPVYPVQLPARRTLPNPSYSQPLPNRPPPPVNFSSHPLYYNPLPQPQPYAHLHPWAHTRNSHERHYRPAYPQPQAQDRRRRSPSPVFPRDPSPEFHRPTWSLPPRRRSTREPEIPKAASVSSSASDTTVTTLSSASSVTSTATESASSASSGSQRRRSRPPVPPRRESSNSSSGDSSTVVPLTELCCSCENSCTPADLLMTQLEGCGHIFCNRCLKYLISSSFRDPKQLPLYPLMCPACYVDGTRPMGRIQDSLMQRLDFRDDPQCIAFWTYLIQLHNRHAQYYPPQQPHYPTTYGVNWNTFVPADNRYHPTNASTYVR